MGGTGTGEDRPVLDRNGEAGWAWKGEKCTEKSWKLEKRIGRCGKARKATVCIAKERIGRTR